MILRNCVYNNTLLHSQNINTIPFREDTIRGVTAKGAKTKIISAKKARPPKEVTTKRKKVTTKREVTTAIINTTPNMERKIVTALERNGHTKKVAAAEVEAVTEADMGVVMVVDTKVCMVKI